MAHHEELRCSWHQRVRDLLWLQGLCDQGVFRKLLSAHVGCDLRHVEQPDGGPPKKAEPWRVTLVDTGENTQTGGRIKRVRDYIDDTFCLTYGDGVSDINLRDLIAFHREQETLATVTAIQPAGRFGSIEIAGARVKSFLEKPRGDNRWISGGFFVCEPEVLDRIESDSTIWEREPLESLALDNQLSVYRHEGFWSAMDTLRDKEYLEKLWNEGKANWKAW